MTERDCIDTANTDVPLVLRAYAVVIFVVASIWQTSVRAQALEVQASQRFERVLWCADRDAGPKLARRLGFTAVQLGRGGDATPLLSLGLRFYLDQPIGMDQALHFISR